MTERESVLAELVEQLQLEKIEENIFRGQSQDLGWGTVFGGQVLGQALSAAQQTVSEGQTVHSLHGYFLRAGRVDAPVVYEVDRIRNGRSFETRRVVAIQHGRAIFNLSCSFQVAEPGFEHTTEPPAVPEPESLLSEQDLAKQVLHLIPPKLQKRLTSVPPIEIRPIRPVNPMAPKAKKPNKALWMKATGALPEDHSIHQFLLAYASDFGFVTTSLLPHAVSWLTPGMQVASIDHAMWFHRPFRMDQWLLHVMESPSASGARGLIRGQIFTRDGLLVASTVQEGLIRNRNITDQTRE